MRSLKINKGCYLSHSSFRQVHYLRDIKEAGLPHSKFNNFRRFFITEFSQRGGSEVALRKIVGHADAEMTYHYTQLASDFSELAKVVSV